MDVPKDSYKKYKKLIISKLPNQHKFQTLFHKKKRSPPQDFIRKDFDYYT